MHVINAVGVNDAYSQGYTWLKINGERQASRAGPVLVAPMPVTTVYHKPTQRVLLDPSRDNNPFFCLFESLHMLAGRNDAKWLDQFVHDFSSRFAEDDGFQHGAYGFRWRRHFDMEGGGNPNLPDQLATVIHMLKKDPDSRRAVIAMWDPVADLGADKRDLPCNTHIYLRVHSPWASPKPSQRAVAPQQLPPVLDIMVCCRSNDMIWGAYGANIVHFSILHEYLAGRLGVDIGTYSQVSFNFHAYLNVLEKVGPPQPLHNYPGTAPMGKYWNEWDADLRRFMNFTQQSRPDTHREFYSNEWFSDTAETMFLAHRLWKLGEKQRAVEYLRSCLAAAPDWRAAGVAWMERRLAKGMTKAAESAAP